MDSWNVNYAIPAARIEHTASRSIAFHVILMGRTITSCLMMFIRMQSALGNNDHL